MKTLYDYLQRHRYQIGPIGRMAAITRAVQEELLTLPQEVAIARDYLVLSSQFEDEALLVKKFGLSPWKGNPDLRSFSHHEIDSALSRAWMQYDELTQAQQKSMLRYVLANAPLIGAFSRAQSAAYLLGFRMTARVFSDLEDLLTPINSSQNHEEENGSSTIPQGKESNSDGNPQGYCPKVTVDNK